MTQVVAASFEDGSIARLATREPHPLGPGIERTHLARGGCGHRATVEIVRIVEGWPDAQAILAAHQRITALC